MQLILFSGEDCKPCEEAEKQFKRIFAEELKNDEAIIARVMSRTTSSGRLIICRLHPAL